MAACPALPCPAGSFLVVPAGIHQRHAAAPASSTTYVYAAGSWAVPLAHLPALAAPTVAVRFCPLLLRLRPESPPAAAAAGEPDGASAGAEVLPDGGADAAAAPAAAAAAGAEAAADRGRSAAALRISVAALTGPPI